MNKKPLTKLKQNALQRRVSVALAGAGSGVRLLGSHAGSMFKEEQEKTVLRQQAMVVEAERFTRTLGELKGAYVKIGQLMAMFGDHLLPEEITGALRQLEQQTEAMSWSALQPVVTEELGERVDDLVISETAIAAASLSQVHRAVVKKDGRQLCLKIQYPGVANTIESDFKTVLQMLKLARWLPSGKEFEDWMQEIKTLLTEEIDYQREAQMTARVAEMVAADPRYVVPCIYPEYSGDTVLGMDYLPGLVVSDARVGRLSLKRRNALASAMLENFFAEVFEWGVMQTDPNFGNYQIQLRSEKQEPDKLVLLDFGAVRVLPEDFQTALQKTILAAHQNKREAVIEGAIELGCLQENQSQSVKESFADFCVLLMEPFRVNHENTPGHALNGRGEYAWQASNLLKRVGKAGARAILTEGFASPPKEFALIARKLTGVFTFITALKAEFNAAPMIEKYLPGRRDKH